MATTLKEQLASSLGKSDEGPNIALAEKLVKKADAAAISELLGYISDRSAAIRNDVIKVIYEIAERNADLITLYTPDMLALLDHKDNRMKWGAMTTLSAISKQYPELLAPHLAKIIDGMDTGSVITRDHGIYILSHISDLPEYYDDCMELLLEQVEKAPVNQMPMYAEHVASKITDKYKKQFLKILSSRQDVMEIPSKQKRIDKIIKKMKI